MADIKIDPRAPKRAILDALCATLDMVSKEGNMALPVREFLAGEMSKDRLIDVLVAHAHAGCQQAAKLSLALREAGVRAPAAVVEAINGTVAHAFADLAMVLTIYAALRQDDERFAGIAEDAIKPAQAVVAQLGGPVAAIDIMFQRACMAPQAAPRTDDIGRNQPCPCGSGTKHKLCCGRAR